jgi:hypothetical protein
MIDIQKQEALRKFVEEEVYTCQSMLVEAGFKQEFFSWDDVDNLYQSFDAISDVTDICNNCGLISDHLDSESGKCRDCYSNDQTIQEVYEWWVVSDLLTIKLRQHGEPLLGNEYGTWWGRCCTGQAIFLDEVIEKIYDEIMRY